MPILFTLDRARRQVRTTVEGCINGNEILDHLDAVLREEALPYAELIDANGARPPHLSPADIWRAAVRVRAVELPAPIGRRAVIAGDDVTFGLTRIFTNIMSGFFPIEVFRDAQRAEEWLGGWSV